MKNDGNETISPKTNTSAANTIALAASIGARLRLLRASWPGSCRWSTQTAMTITPSTQIVSWPSWKPGSENACPSGRP